MKHGVTKSVLYLRGNCYGLLLALASSIAPVSFMLTPAPGSPDYQSQGFLTPLQLEIEKQRQRLNSTGVEERRDAVMRLGGLRRPEAARAALAALKDPVAIVRVAAAAAILLLPANERATALIPLLNDNDEF